MPLSEYPCYPIQLNVEDISDAESLWGSGPECDKEPILEKCVENLTPGDIKQLIEMAERITA